MTTHGPADVYALRSTPRRILHRKIHGYRMVPLLADKVIDPTFSNFRASGTQIADPDHTVCLLEIAYGVMASAYLKLGEKTKANEIFQHALALNPNYPHVLNNLGALAAQDGRIAEAEALFLRAKEIMGRHEMSPYANLGNIYEMTGRIRDALRMYETAVALKPEFGSSWYTVARLRVLSGDPAGAYSPLARAIALDEGWRARAAKAAVFEDVRQGDPRVRILLRLE
ncbi:MAG: tetratricopeptide repeat protein [candidate division NC10 bacterium]